MSQFIVFDFNGWFDSILEEDGRFRALGFRSCLYRQDEIWMLGSQALAAARSAVASEPLVSGASALIRAAGQGTFSQTEQSALPAAMWRFVADATHRSASHEPIHAALIIPDNQYLGRVKVKKGVGKTALEILYDTIEQSRPRGLTGSRVELVWRSVATLKAILNFRPLGSEPGCVLVISTSPTVSWTILKLDQWYGDRQGENCDNLHIIRSPVMQDCDKGEAWTYRKMRAVSERIATQYPSAVKKIKRWTRLVEITAAEMNDESLDAFGIDASAIENWSWPEPDGRWVVMPKKVSLKDDLSSQTSDALPAALVKQIEDFLCMGDIDPLAIIIENPIQCGILSDFQASIGKIVSNVPIYTVLGPELVEAAAGLAKSLGKDPKAPAWLDSVPEIDLEVRSKVNKKSGRSTSKWMTIIGTNEVIPAGETYRTRSDPKRRVTLAPGIEYVHLHFRRGYAGRWDDRYSGRETGHRINPSDHARVVEPVARLRPLSGEARIEIMEHLPGGSEEILSGSKTGIKWSEMCKDRPMLLRSIPDLYVFKCNEAAWKELESLLKQVVDSAKRSNEVCPELRNKLYKCTNRRWREREFPLGSDGRPPYTGNRSKHTRSQQLLAEATEELCADLRGYVEREIRRNKPKEANRLHLPLTWLFTGCPEKVTDILLDAIINPEGAAGRTLYIENKWSSWAIYSGVGRTARNDDDLRMIFDKLIGCWENKDGLCQDKYLLAAVTHPMARRVGVRFVLRECKERFERVKRFLFRQLNNLLDGISDPRPLGPEPSLELRYVTMGYRGLCQVRYDNPDWFDEKGEEAREVYLKLRDASKFGKEFEKDLVSRTAPYLIGKGEDPTMPGGF